jgi:hypothetical protein
MADAGSQELLSDHLIAHDKGGYQAQFLRIARGQWAMPIRLKSANCGHRRLLKLYLMAVAPGASSCEPAVQGRILRRTIRRLWARNAARRARFSPNQKEVGP